MPDIAAAIRFAGISKTFGPQRVLDDIEISVNPGTVHALLGENGSGKSTLIKILAGVYTADPGGTIFIEGNQLTPGSPPDSHQSGLRFVHQKLAIIPEFNAVENVAMEIGYSRPGFIDWKAQAEETRRLLAQLRVTMDIWRPMSQCRQIEQSAVAIARAISTHHGRVTTLILDEPTSSLPQAEVGQLFEVIRELAAQGIAVVYVTHHLDEVFQIADTVSVLRDGKLRGTVSRTSLTRAGLVEMIVGRNLVEATGSSAIAPTAGATRTVMKVEGLSAGRVTELSFTLAAGEVLGIVGLADSGREDVARALVGVIPSDVGRLEIAGEDFSNPNPILGLKRGIVLGLSNTQKDSAVRELSISDTITSSSLTRYRRRFGPVRSRQQKRVTKQWIDEFDIRPRDPDRQFGMLSGGNQQKVILARCLNADPSVLILDDPTVGVDIGARQTIYRIIAEQAERGMGIVVSSSSLEDITRTCSRALVLSRGRVVAEIRGELTEHALLSAAAHGIEADQSASDAALQTH